MVGTAQAARTKYATPSQNESKKSVTATPIAT